MSALRTSGRSGRSSESGEGSAATGRRLLVLARVAHVVSRFVPSRRSPPAQTRTPAWPAGRVRLGGMARGDSMGRRGPGGSTTATTVSTRGARAVSGGGA